MSSYSTSSEQRPSAELINIIKELFYNNNENFDERDRIIKKVEVQFKECDERIDKYIKYSSKDLTNLIKVFNEIARKVEQSRANVSSSRDALKQCKILLQSKRDDVRRLWVEWCEQKCYYENISKIRSLYMASESIRELCSQKKYLEAAQKISEYTLLVDNDFKDVLGLKDIKRNLEDERIKLEKHLLEELAEQLYTLVTKSVLESGSSSSNPASGGSSTGLSREASFKRRFRYNVQARANNDDDSSTSSDSKADDYSANSVIEKLVQAAAKLNNSETNINIVEKMINDINKDITNQLISMINATSTHVLESNLIDNSKNPNRPKHIENNPKFLSQLIDLTVEQFKIMGRNYKHFIDCSSKENKQKYNAGLVWNCIQNVLIQLLEEYLDIANKLGGLGNVETSLEKIDINSFFQKKRYLNLPFGDSSSSTNPNPSMQTNTGNQAMSNSGGFIAGDDSSRAQHRIFTFKGTSHAISIKNYNRELNNENLFSNNLDLDGGEGNSNASTSAIEEQRIFKILVCQPAHKNITAIFSTMEHVLKDISDEIRMLPAPVEGLQKPDLTLEKFMQEFISKTFITNAVESIKENARIHENTNDGQYEISKQLIPFAKQRDLGLNKPILSNILLVYQSCSDLFNLVQDMSSYASHFTAAMYSIIQNHVTYCNKIFLSIVSNETNPNDASNNISEDNFVYSMKWVRDDNINQYFKQLPSFSAAIKGKLSPAAMFAKKNNQNNIVIGSSVNQDALMAAKVEVEQTDVEVLSKEVETLLENLNENELDDIDIIKNFNHIEMVAHLHESFDWLIIQLKQIVNALEQMVKNPKSLNSTLSLGELSRFKELLEELEKWRGDTLLLLYLETRVHCFYHLRTFLKQESNTSYAGDVDTDPDDCVLDMNRDLHRIYENLSRSLQEGKVNYVFDALGFMVASIFVRAIKNFKKISSHGIAKMCRNIFHVEQNLSAIRSKSDPHLMKAQRFYELLYKKPEEVNNHLIEHEAEFKLKDYTNLLNLIYKSQPGYEINSLSENIASLEKILNGKN